jgi:hypothetical protein
MQAGYGVALEAHPRNGAVLLKDTTSSAFPVKTMELHPELDAGMTLYTSARADIGAPLRRALEERGVPHDSISFVGPEGPSQKSVLTIRGISAEALAEMLQQNHPMYNDDRFRGALCSPNLASTLARGYGPLKAEVTQQEDVLRGVPFN